MNTETLRILDSIARDRNIERDVLIQDLEQAMISAARKHFNSLDTEEFGCEMDRLTGAIRIWRNNEDGTPEEIPLESLGRIPAHYRRARTRGDEARASSCAESRVRVRSGSQRELS